MAKNSNLLWRLYSSYVVVILVSLLVLGFLATDAIYHVSIQHTKDHLQSNALLVARLLQGRFEFQDGAFVDALCKEISPRIGARITVLTSTGKVLGDSHVAAARMESKVARPETKAALEGKIGTSERYSFTLGKPMIYVAVPEQKDSRTIGIVRLATETKSKSDLFRQNYESFALAGATIAVLAGVLSLFVCFRISRFVKGMAQGAMRFAKGELDYRVDPTGPEEFVALAIAMNSMAEELNARIEAITRQKVELETVLSGMVEAVFVLDTGERFVRVNRTAEMMFGIRQERIQGRRFHETLRNTDLHRFVSNALAASEPLETEIVLLQETDIFLHAYGCPLREPDGRQTGALVVLHDVTRLKVLEKIRRDFVANVSHELNTPVTAIKGFLETLKEGALKDPENAERFLDIAIRHTDRLGLIIQDLLSLSRIEQDSERGQIPLDDYPLEILGEAVHRVCGASAQAKNISLEFKSPPGMVAKINPTLLEQALVNLVDNAIKYSEAGRTVSVQIARADSYITISVRDQGWGISKEYLSRIFERFYRIDKGRSRKEGGTGLGLAIVKHIVNAHNGRITVDSSPGRGSTFTIHLPVS